MINYKNRKYVIFIIFALIIIFIIWFNTRSLKLTALEKVSLETYSEEVVNYLDIIEGAKKDEIDKYIVYALVNNYNEKNTTSLNNAELVDFINNHFDVNVSLNDISNVGTTEFMMKNYITYDFSANEYKILKTKLTNPEVANIPLTMYFPKKIVKKKKYINVYYEKYVITNPYTIQNYYTDNRIDIDMKDITDYLSGDASMKTIKKYVTRENVDKIGKYEGKVKISYIVKDGNVIIKQ